MNWEPASGKAIALEEKKRASFVLQMKDMTRWRVVVSLFVVVAADSSSSSSSDFPKGLAWLTYDCGISTSVRVLSAKLLRRFLPNEICMTHWHEAYLEYHRSLYWERGRISLIDLLASRRLPQEILDSGRFNFSLSHLSKVRMECRRQFVLSKVETSLIRLNETTDFDVVPLPFELVAARRANVFDVAACAVHDGMLHRLPMPGIESLEEIGTKVYADSGEPVVEKMGTGDSWRDDRGSTRAKMNVANLNKVLDSILAGTTNELHATLKRFGAPVTVLETDDLIDLSSEEKVRNAAVTWLYVLKRVNVDVDLDDVVRFLSSEAPAYTVPCTRADKIYNFDEVRQALNGTAYEHFLDCP